MFDDLKKLKTSCVDADDKVAKAEELRVATYSELHKKQDEAKELLGVQSVQIPNLNFNIPGISFGGNGFKKVMAVVGAAVLLSWFVPPVISLIAAIIIGVWVGVTLINNTKH